MPSLLTGLGLCLLAVAAGVVATWGTRRTDGLGRPRPFPAWTVAVLVLLALAAVVPGAKRRVEEQRLASVATRLVGHKVSVHCQSTAAALVDAGAELGFVRFTEDGDPEPVTTIKREPCGELRRYLHGDKASPTRAQVVAVHVLTHEAMHLRGQLGESRAECEAVQRDAQTARMLGASLEQAQRLAEAYWEGVYPNMPDEYRSRDCRPGGPWDEQLGAGPWT